VKAPEPAKPAGADRLVLADSDPAATRPPAEQQQPQAPADGREEALTRQIEALTKEVAKMREDMDKMAARNRELAKEAESSKTGWFAAGGLGIALAGLALGMFGRREKKMSWRDNLPPSEEDEAAFPQRDALPEVREELVPDPKSTTAAAPVSQVLSQPDTVTDLDVTKLRVHETGLGEGTTADATAFPQDILESWTTAEKAGTIKSLDFSLDDVDLGTKAPDLGAKAPDPGAKAPDPAPPVFKPKADEVPSEAARNALFEQIERVHQASKKG
jgi:hypothetical protein